MILHFTRNLNNILEIKMALTQFCISKKNPQISHSIATLLKAKQKHGKDAIPITQANHFTNNETGYNSYFDRDDFYFIS